MWVVSCKQQAKIEGITVKAVQVIQLIEKQFKLQKDLKIGHFKTITYW